MFAFACGAAAWCFRDRIVLAPVGAAIAVLVTAVGISLGSYPVIVLGIGYLVLAAAWLPFRWEHDISYGVYVLAYPIEVLVAMTAIRALGIGALIGVSLAIVIPLAFLSWVLVERPAMALRHRAAARRPAILPMTERAEGAELATD
jgi:peptidoglycan/LPS O-acetylase OafA/YrhL